MDNQAVYLLDITKCV